MPHVTGMRRARWLVLIVGAIGVLAAAPRPPVHAVAIDGTSFNPKALTVKVGDVVVWENKDPFPHTATSRAAGFDSQAIAPGKTFKYTAKTKGEFEYVCLFHPTMKATLKVE